MVRALESGSSLGLASAGVIFLVFLGNIHCVLYPHSLSMS